MTARPAGAFPVGGRRLVVVTVYSRRQEADPVLLRALGGLRPHATELVVVVNGGMDREGRDRLGRLADRVMLRENSGFDVAAQRDALQEVGERVADFDEVLLTNDTWYGPMTDFTALFARMDATSADFWGLTAHPAVDWIPRHVQSYWFAARRAVATSAVWRGHWRDQPDHATYWDAVIGHELALTALLEAEGFVGATAFEGPPGRNATIVDAAELLAAGCPVLKKRVFFFDPPELARRGGDARAAAHAAEAAGYPSDVLWQHLARTVAPATLAASCAQVETVAESDASSRAARVLIVADLDGDDDRQALPARLDAHVDDQDVIVTGPAAGARRFPAARSVRHDGDRRGLRAAIAAVSGSEVGTWDAVVVLDGATGVRSQRAVSTILDGGVARLVRDPALGLVLPAPAPGDRVDRPSADDLSSVHVARERADIRVPIDDGPPLAPTAGVWAGRPAVLARLAAAASDPLVTDRALTAVLAAAAGEEGLLTVSLTTRADALRTVALGFVPDRDAEPATEAAIPASAPTSFLGRLRRRVIG